MDLGVQIDGGEASNIFTCLILELPKLQCCAALVEAPRSQVSVFQDTCNWLLLLDKS